MAGAPRDPATPRARPGTGALAAGLLLLMAAAAAAILLLGGEDDGKATAAEGRPGQPTVRIIAPRNGSEHQNHSVVVKAEVENFELSPERFGDPPELNQGHLRFSLNRIPDCVDPEKLERAINSPLAKGRLQGRSFDYPVFSGPNGLLARRVNSEGSYSPATKPEIYYENLPAGVYRLVITLAQNDGTTTPFHSVTNFQVLPRPGFEPPPCPEGKVSTSKIDA